MSADCYGLMLSFDLGYRVHFCGVILNHNNNCSLKNIRGYHTFPDSIDAAAE